MLSGADFIRANARLQRAPLVPELCFWGADDVTTLWHATEELLEKAGVEPPFWAFAWPGSQALARWVLDHPEEVAGRRVLDVGAGCGLAAMAAARAGALAVANDVDALATTATELNAAENGVSVQTITADLTLGGTPVEADLVLVGDLCYERDTAARLMAWLQGVARDRRVILAEPGRAFAPREGVRPVGRYRVPTTRELEDREEREVILLEVVPRQGD